MNRIEVLSPETVDQIAAGEVVERPSSVVKELVENAIDAGAGAVTVEIRDGGISLIRVTDNGEGIEADQVRTAFLAHATSKLRRIDDLMTISSLGFRGEALSSICAVSRMELITKQAGQLTGVRYQIEGGKEQLFEEIGAPEGSTFLVRDLFYNTPARKKFLRTASTEAGYVSNLIEHLALSHPGVAFSLIAGGQTKLHTSGNGNLKDVIYHIYGRETAGAILPVDYCSERMKVTGFLGMSQISRGNRSYETTFVNGRFIHNAVLSKAIEEGYGTSLMQHRYPFTVLLIEIDGSQVDVNVHPSKMEVRFSDPAGIHQELRELVAQALSQVAMIPGASPEGAKEEERARRLEKKEQQERNGAVEKTEPFETIRRSLFTTKDSPYQPRYNDRHHAAGLSVSSAAGAQTVREPGQVYDHFQSIPTEGLTKKQTPAEGSAAAATAKTAAVPDSHELKNPDVDMLQHKPVPDSEPQIPSGVQATLFEDHFLAKESLEKIRVIGQAFDTFWLAQFQDSLYIIDQHAAHEKVLYERLVRQLKERNATSQQISPPLVVTLTLQEEQLLQQYLPWFQQTGFEISHFGGHEYSISAMPDHLPILADTQLFAQMLDSLSESVRQPSMDFLLDRLASMACKAAVKGHDHLSFSEAQALLEELMELDDPYHCPHGRPTIIRMTHSDLDKKFRRIV